MNNNNATGNSNGNGNNIACPHELYHILKDVKMELLLGPSILNGGGCHETTTPDTRDTDSDADSILNSDRDSSSSSTSEEESTTMLASSFRHHLLGLHTILHQLADTADNITNRYVDEVERDGGRR